MQKTGFTETENYFHHLGSIGIIGRGENIESCFCHTAKNLFSLLSNVQDIHTIQIVTFEFEEENIEIALMKWLNLILIKAHEHHLFLGDFRLKHKGNRWKATVSGEPRRVNAEGNLEIKAATPIILSIKKIEHTWEARCVIEVDKLDSVNS